jgi:hypothetical protein
MSDNDPLKPVRRPIVIDEVREEKGKTGRDLKHCYFLPTDIKGFYNFFDEHGRTLATGVSSDKPFPFLLDGHAWTIQMGTINDLVASGSWTNNAPAPINPGSGPAAEQDGSFQASSSGGVEPDAMAEDVADTPPSNAVVIEGVEGTSDKDKLKGCYFLASGGAWNLYNKKGGVLKTGISSGNDFSFDHDKDANNTTITWTVTDFVISTQDLITTASGNWTNTDPTIVNEQSGSFQASSSGGIGEGEVASGASA